MSDDINPNKLHPLNVERPRMQPGFFVPDHRKMPDTDSERIASGFLQVVRDCERDGEDKGTSTLRITNAVKALVPEHTTVDIVGITLYNGKWAVALGICWQGQYPHTCYALITRWWV